VSQVSQKSQKSQETHESQESQLTRFAEMLVDKKGEMTHCATTMVKVYFLKKLL
jgi:hypothetical protein